MLATGLFSTLKATSGIGLGIIFQLLTSVGLGILQAGPIFPILAPIDVSLSANALAFFMFVRFMSQVSWSTFSSAVISEHLLTIPCATDMGHLDRWRRYPERAREQATKRTPVAAPIRDIDCIFSC